MSLLTILFAFVNFAVLAISVPPPSGPTAIVNLRIEGRSSTIFEGYISTKGHDVTTASGGTHHCDGTNNNQNPNPGSTCTSALDTASNNYNFPWDATFFTQFDDYFITSIGSDTQTSTEFWGILLNYQFTPVGGCQQQVHTSDEVLFAFDAFSKSHFLKLSGPNTTQVNQPAQLTVVDGSTGTPIAGATVNGQTSDAQGHVSVTFGSTGLQTVKAEKSDSIRSNGLKILVV
ncbi:hypothetical protein AMATHDRAFT_65767 [Amanita thiersii Skay4041]|uniref:Big-1 domain-containing protein n=1 Tax=Amanita thiersii Skay4041 TaxID=703135 RepID=A0A2A9NG52_9AGAR|nr:hypothetical protein AMATHDRAFT_65767 [Amanita thiersii Skay4041]